MPSVAPQPHHPSVLTTGRQALAHVLTSASLLACAELAGQRMQGRGVGCRGCTAAASKARQPGTGLMLHLHA